MGTDSSHELGPTGVRHGELFRLAFEVAPLGLLISDRDGKILFANARLETMFGYPRAELVGKHVAQLVPSRYRAREPELRAAFFDAPSARVLGARRDLHGLRKDGTEMPIEIELSPLETATGVFAVSSIMDVSERRRTIQQLRQRSEEFAASAKERDLLLQEVHHRVKNNLQVISSLINLQIRKGSGGAPHEVLTECKRRVEAIGLIHEKLYQSRDYTRVPFSDYARSLARNIVHASDASMSGIELQIESDDISLPVDKAISCGLILNELITNAMKHAFSEGDRGRLYVGLHRIADHRVRLRVKDSGIGLREPEQSSATSLGLLLVNTLTAQLEGTLRTEIDAGTTVSVEFPAQV